MLGLAAIAGTWHWRLAEPAPRADRRVVHEAQNFHGVLAVQRRGIGTRQPRTSASGTRSRKCR